MALGSEGKLGSSELNEIKYDIIEKNKKIRDQTLSLMMGKHLVQGIAYFCLIESGQPMSPRDMTQFLKLSDKSYINSFNQAVLDLVEKGLVQAIN